MESYYLDWANLLLRWVHVITAIAWIGSSFYFVFLDSSLTPAQDEDQVRAAREGIGADGILLVDAGTVFGDDVEAQAVAHGDDGMGNRHIVGIRRYVLDERAVDFQRMHRETLKVSERGIAGAEIIDREVNPHRAQFAQESLLLLGQRSL